MNACNGSAMPRSSVNTGANVRLAECRVGAFDVFDVYRTERRLRLFESRAGLKLNELILEIMTRKSGDNLVALLWRIFIKSDPDHVHNHACLRECDFRPHVVGDAWRGVQGDSFPNKVRLGLWNAVTSQEFARGVSAIDFKPLGIGFVGLDKAHVVKQRGDIEQLRIEFETLPDTLHSSEHISANAVVE